MPAKLSDATCQTQLVRYHRGVSALVFAIEPENIYLATDTLCLSAETKAPCFFTTKMYFLPHLGMVMVGTGLANAVSEWFLRLNAGLIARNMDHVDQYAPRMLSELFDDARTKFGSTAGTVTIYHFGYSQRAGRMLAYIYRSESAFRSEILEDSVGVKPAPNGGQAEIVVREVPRDFVTIINGLRQEDLARSNADRIGIGGEVLYCWLSSDQCVTYTAHRFEDWETTYELICRQLS